MQEPALNRILVIIRGPQSGKGPPHVVQGLTMFAKQLQQKHHIVTDQVSAVTDEEIEAAFLARKEGTTAVIFILSWADSPDSVARLFQRLSKTDTSPKLLFLDYYDQTSTPHFGVLPYVDVYVKSQILKDKEEYQRDFQGGYVFTDFLAKQFGYELNGWNFGSKPAPTQHHKITYGWNLGVKPANRLLLRLTRNFGLPWEFRPVAINRRIGLLTNSKKEWYQQYREYAVRKISSLESKYRLSGMKRISLKAYLAEMALSKLVISPFGWGEVCHRDYEAVAAGALLVKPSMEHLVTSPDIFRPNETYVPVRWDLEDLADKCEYYLSHPRESAEIARNAQQVLNRYYEHGGFADDLARTLKVAP